MACLLTCITIVGLSLIAAVTTSLVDENKCSKFEYEFCVFERIISLENKNADLARKQVVLERKNEELLDLLKEQRLKFEGVNQEQDKAREKLKHALEKKDSEWTKRNETRVSFSARIGHNKKYTSKEPLVFKTVLNNDGDAYNANTGVFTAPVDGKYWFSVSISVWYNQAYASVWVTKNNQHLVEAMVDNRSGSADNYETSSVSTVMDLKRADTVHCEWSYGSTSTPYNVYHRNLNTFSGALLYT